MCPDPQMLSLYYDGELPSPWKEKLEAHLRECSHCSSYLEQFRLLSGTLEVGAFHDETELPGDTPKERIWLRLNSPAVTERKFLSWNRSISVPLPLAIAAAALVLVFGFFFIKSPKVSVPMDSTMAAMDMQTIMPASDLNGVLQFLGNDDSPDIVIIHLPESRNFMISGEPAMIRAADYVRGKGSR